MLSTADMIIIILYILMVLAIGWYVGRDNENTNDYFLAGRNLSWFPIAMSVAATMISANGFIGGPGWAYQSGLSPFMVNVAVPLAIFIVMTVTMPMFYSLKLTSVYEYIELRLGHRSRLAIVIGFFMNSLIQVSSMVLIPALIIRTFTGWPLELIIIATVVITIVYSSFGGMKAVIWTDVMQMFVMWMGLFIAFAILMDSMDASLTSSIVALKESGKMKALDFSFDVSKTEAFWATLIGGGFMWLRYFGFDQVQVQRVMTAKSLKTVKKTFLFSAIMMNVIYFAFMLMGVLLFEYYGGKSFENANGVMIDFITSNFPIGAIGLVIAGVFAAAMSSIDSLFNSMSTVFITDIYQRYYSKTNQTTSLKKSKALTLIWGTLVILITIIAFSGTTKSVIAVVGSYISNISGPFCGAFILALFTKKANDKGTLFGILSGFIMVLFLGKMYPIAWIWKPFIGSVFTVVMGYLVSLFTGTDKGDKEVYRYTIMGHRDHMIQSGRIMEGNTSLLPLQVDAYGMMTLLFFIVQYVLLANIG